MAAQSDTDRRPGAGDRLRALLRDRHHTAADRIAALRIGLRRPGGTLASASTSACTVYGQLYDTGSVRGHRRGRVLERRLATGRHGTALGTTPAAAIVATTTTAVADDRLLDTRSIRRYRRRRLLQRRLAAPRHGAAWRHLSAGTASASFTDASSADADNVRRLHDS